MIGVVLSLILEGLVKNIEVSIKSDLKTIPMQVLQQITLQTPPENTPNMASAANDNNLPCPPWFRHAETMVKGTEMGYHNF